MDDHVYFRGKYSISSIVKHHMTNGVSLCPFQGYVKKMDMKFSRQGRNVLFFVDNCSAHSHDLQRHLKSIKLIFFPPNATSVLQPCDQGIIQNMKVHYRRYLLEKLLSLMESGRSSSDFQINIMDALFNLRRAWTTVSSETIANCFKHAGFSSGSTGTDEIPSPAKISPLDNIFERLKAAGFQVNHVSVDEYANVDHEVVVEMPLTDADIASAVMTSCVDNVLSDSDSDDGLPAPVENVTIADARAAVRTLRNYFSSIDGQDAVFDIVESLERHVEETFKGRQTKITDFFFKK
jgi:hypothetical protein